MVFSGTVESDFLKLVGVDLSKRSNLINYAATDFLTLRSSILEYIKAVYPLDYNNFIESDLGIMIAEMPAYMGSVLSFKADMLANENFLRTARKRNSIKKLIELVGVRMKGPIAAAANAQITVVNPTWADPEDSDITIEPSQRTIETISPEDNAPVTYTLYKVTDEGRVNLANNTGNITLNTSSDADNTAGTIYTNLVLLEGTLVTEQGEFTSPDATKRISLGQGPVIEGSVDVYINGDNVTSGVYSQVDNIFFASGSEDKIFQLVTTDDFNATIVFGDNTLGVSPRVGDTYFVTYRVGGGSRGNLASRVIDTNVTIVDASATSVASLVENISLATGGADAETVEHVKKYAPLTFRRQDRIVTLLDFKAFTNNFISSYGTVGKATAAVRRAFSSANVIDVFVLEKANNFQLRKATPEFKVQLLQSMEAKKMLTDEIVVVDGLIRTVDLAVTIRVDRELSPQEETIKLKARDAILDFFRVDNNDFGKDLIAADLNRSVFEIPEVRYATIDNIDEIVHVGFNEIVQLNNLSLSVNFV
jgi:hypothetical protein